MAARPRSHDTTPWGVRLLLAAYPRYFRRDYGAEIAFALAGQRRDARRRGLHPARFWLRATFDLIPAASRLRLARLLGGVGSPGRPEPPRNPRRLFDSMFQDARYALRALRKAPTFTALTILLLTVGIGANSAIFTLVSAYVLRPYPYESPERLYTVHSSITRLGIDHGQFSVRDYLDVRAAQTGIEELALWRMRSYNVASDEAAVRIPGAHVSANFFDVLGVRPLLGRTFHTGEDRPGTRRVVLAEGTWRRDFGADPEIIGSEILLDNETHVVVGVIPAGTEFPENRRLWKAELAEPDDREPRYRRINTAVGRVAQGETEATVRERLDRIAARLEADHPESNRGVGFALQPIRDYRIGGTGTRLAVLMGAVGFLLLIVCVNVANLQLARADRRRHELSIRAALGAGRARIVRQLIAESTLTAIVGAVAGLALGYAAVRAIVATFPRPLSPWYDLTPDLRVGAFVVGAAVLTVVLSGLLPALRAAGSDPAGNLKPERATGTDVRQRRLLSTLMAVEVALSVVLLVGAGLTMRSFARLNAVDPGFATEQRLTVSVMPPQATYDMAARVVFVEELEQRLRALPGVGSVGAAAVLPLVGTATTGVQADSQTPDEAKDNPSIMFYPVTPGYFETMGIPLRSGRDFDWSDNLDAEMSVIVGERMARLFWGTDDPVGRRVRQNDSAWLTVVGVVGDVRQRDIGAPPEPQMYLPYAQDPWQGMAVVLHTEIEPQGLLEPARRELRAMDPSMAAYNVMTLEDAVYQQTFLWRLQSTLVWIFGSIALLLAASGLYAVISYAVARRTREIGVRMALGAARRDVLRMVGRAGFRVVAAGMVAGLAGAALLSRWLQSVLYETSALDPVTYVAVGALLGLVTVLATLAPARRAARLDPVVALRDD